jgi:hypothetical protein
MWLIRRPDGHSREVPLLWQQRMVVHLTYACSAVPLVALLTAAAELQAAPNCRARAPDSMHQQVTWAVAAWVGCMAVCSAEQNEFLITSYTRAEGMKPVKLHAYDHCFNNSSYMPLRAG